MSISARAFSSVSISIVCLRSSGRGMFVAVTFTTSSAEELSSKLRMPGMSGSFLEVLRARVRMLSIMASNSLSSASGMISGRILPVTEMAPGTAFPEPGPVMAK